MIPVTRLDDGAVAYVCCEHCDSIDVTWEYVDWTDEHAAPGERKRFRASIVTCHSGEGCPEQDLYKLWPAAERRLPPLVGTEPTRAMLKAQDRYRPTGRRQQVLVRLLRGAQDGHEIGAAIGCDHNQVGTRAKELEEAGWVHRVGRRKGPRGPKVTVYALTTTGREVATRFANDQTRKAA